MLEAIYTVIALQIIILVFVPYLILRRWVVNLIERYAETRKSHFEPHVLNLLNDPTTTEPLESNLRPGDRKLIKDLLLQQATQLKGEDKRTMTAVFEKMGYVKNEMAALRSRRWWRRLEAAINLGIIQSQISVAALIHAIKDPVEDVRLAAVRALGQLNERGGLQLLLDTVEERSHWTGSSIIETLIGMGPEINPEIVPRLQATTNNVNARLLYAQLCGLRKITEALEPLLWLLRDPDQETRISAARALGQLGDISAVKSLIDSLDDKTWEVRAQAAKALGALGDKQAVAKLKGSLSDDNWWVRHNTAEALYRLGGEGIKVLRETSHLGEGAPRNASAQVLAERALGV